MVMGKSDWKGGGGVGEGEQKGGESNISCFH